MSLNEALVTDVRQVLRQIRKKPAFAGRVILVLGAGLAVSTAMFSTIRTVLLNPLPYCSPERLVQIVSRWPKTGDQNGWSAPLRDAVDWKATVPLSKTLPRIEGYLLLGVMPQGQSSFGVRPFDPGTLLSSVLGLVGVTTLAALIPGFSAEHAGKDHDQPDVQGAVSTDQRRPRLAR
jgi:hypothetical protein